MAVVSLVICILLLLFFMFFKVEQNHLTDKALLERELILAEKVKQLEGRLRTSADSLNEVRILLQSKKNLSADEIKNIIALSPQKEAVVFFVSVKGELFSSDQEWSSAQESFIKLDENQYSKFSKVRGSDSSAEGPWSAIYLDEHIKQYVMTYSTPVYIQGEFEGTVGILIAVDPIIIEATKTTNDVEVFIHNDEGDLIYHPGYGLKFIRESDSYGAGFSAQGYLTTGLASYIKQNLQGLNPQTFNERQNRYLVNSATLDTIGWTVVTYQNKHDVLHELNQNALRYFFISVTVILLSSLVVAFCVKLFLIKEINNISTMIKNDNSLSSLKKRRKVDDEFSIMVDATVTRIATLQHEVTQSTKKAQELGDKFLESRGLAQAISYSDSAVITMDTDFKIIYVDAKALRLLGMERDSMVGQSYFDLVHPHMAFMTEQITNEIRRKQSWRGELTLMGVKSDAEIWSNCTISPMRDDDGKVFRYVISLQDISSIKDSQNKIERLAYSDDLTGLSNRTFFVAQLEKLVEISKRGRYDFALVYFDIDDFKKVNDLFGHEVGDLLLKEFSLRLKQEIRNEDTLARMSGDEFAMLLGGIKSEQDVIVKVNSIINAANQPFMIKEHVITSGVSIGLTMSQTDTQDPELLLQHADLAMHEAKSLGKNTYHFYTKALNDTTRLRIQMENALSKAIENDELELYFQPKVNSKTSELVGFEALLRWHNDELGYVSPAHFIPLAEQSNLILNIGHWVIQEAVAFVSQLSNKVTVSINLSAKQFESGNVINEIKDALDRYNISPSLIEVEITESSLMKDVEDAIRQLYSIKALGVGISIDDFGTGYSSLSYIKRFPVETLKIDRSFIQDIPDDENDMEITAAIIAMAQKLGLKVIAEGAETKEQVKFLADNGCDLIQGYFYSKPLSAAKALTWQPTQNNG